MRPIFVATILCALGASALAQDDTAKPAPAPAATKKVKAAKPPADDIIVINAGGDVSYANGWNGEDVCDKMGAELFASIRPLLAQGDLNFANLETPFTEATPAVQKEFIIVSKPHRLKWLTDAGFNLFSNANNHSMDAGKQGLQDTLALLASLTSEERPLVWAGTGVTSDEAKEVKIFTPKGKRTKVAFMALGNNGSNLVASVYAKDVPERIKAAAASADVVIVSAHHGTEYQHVPSPETVRMYHGFIDAGAKIVFAHHPHVIQGVERYNGGVIFYSLGNLSFNSKTKRHHETGAKLYSMLGRVVVKNGQIDSVGAFPLYANNTEPLVVGGEKLMPRHAQPQLLTGAFANKVLEDLVTWSRKIPSKAPPTAYTSAFDALVVGDGAPPAVATAPAASPAPAGTGTGPAQAAPTDTP